MSEEFCREEIQKNSKVDNNHEHHCDLQARANNPNYLLQKPINECLQCFEAAMQVEAMLV